MQVAFYLAGEITQVKESIPGVRCASGNDKFIIGDHIKQFWWSLQIAAKISGQRCPFPGRLPHGSWSCEMQEIPIQGTSFLDEDVQSYPGKGKHRKNCETALIKV